VKRSKVLPFHTKKLNAYILYKKITLMLSITEATQEWRKETDFIRQSLGPAQNVPQAGG
jgi:hypothetical protein